MTGNEFRDYIVSSRVSVSELAKKMGTTPQVISNKYNRQKISSDFLDSVKSAIEECRQEHDVQFNSIAPPATTTETQGETIAILRAENKILKEQNEFLQKMLDRLTYTNNK